MSTWLTRFGGLLALGALIGCSGDSPQMPGSCATSDDCGADMVCDDGLCIDDPSITPPDTDTGDTGDTGDTDPPPGDLSGIGEGCETDKDCDRNLTCVPDTEGNRTCTRACDFQDPTDCHEEGMECKMYQTGGETIAMCLPRPDVLCQPCESDGECGGSSQCRVQDDGAACGITCSDTLPCPDNYECLALHDGETNVYQCEPLMGLCYVCVDEDGDGFPAPGMNLDCMDRPVDCDDSNLNAYPGGIEVCDGVDNNCDGVIDEQYVDENGVYFRDQNCGTCGNSCYDALGVEEGQCVIEEGVAACQATVCDEGRLNCDGDAATCEAQENAVTSCGSCGVVCSGANTSSATCEQGSDGLYGCNLVCSAGWADCDGDPSNGCETNLMDDLNSCGSCGDVCGFDNGDATCLSGSCQFDGCSDGYGDCDGDLSNGCEATLDTLTDCGLCGNTCAAVNTHPLASPRCEAPTEGATPMCIMPCADGWADCDGDPRNGCEVNTRTDANNCNACGRSCSVDGASASCGAGECRFEGCDTDFMDCDSDMGAISVSFRPEDNPTGCEINVRDNDDDCGACGNDCSAMTGGSFECIGLSCIASDCSPGLITCEPGVENQCKVSRDDVETCGSCDVSCMAPPGVSTPHIEEASCTKVGSQRSCDIVSCDAGWATCDNKWSTGCETNTTIAAQNCGSCGISCDRANAVTSCDNSVCSLDSCQPGWTDLDGNEANGCEYQCAFSSADDVPADLTVAGYNHRAADLNCDGIDGTISRAWFVDVASGSDVLGDGSMEKPFSTIMKAMSNVNIASPRTHIYVSVGTYQEKVVLQDGVGLYGGFRASQGWSRSPSNETIIRAVQTSEDGSYYTMVGRNLTSLMALPRLPMGMSVPPSTGPLHQGTVVQNLTVEASSASHTLSGTRVGASSTALYCSNCPQLRVIGNRIVSGNASSGIAGSPGNDGDDGEAGKQPGTPTDRKTRTPGDGGAGGAGCSAPSGGRGGTGASPGNNSGEKAADGSGEYPGDGGAGGHGRGWTDGATSQEGFNGDRGDKDDAGSAPGEEGTAGLRSGILQNDFWRPLVGLVGQAGESGSSGGGGGGGGGKDRWPSSNTAGGGGGGGGGAGCGGAGGSGGGGGGSSFGIFLVSPVPAAGNIVNNRISTGTAGNGGGGGQGGKGGNGGAGGEGGTGGTKAGKGGYGGAGSSGGAGGSGGGGAGGSSVAIAGSGASAAVLNALFAGNTAQSLGSAGSGGGNGASGVSANAQAF